MPFFVIEGYRVITHNDLKLWSKSVLEKKTPKWIELIHFFLQNWFSYNKTIEIQTSGTTKDSQKIIKKKKYLEFSAQETIDYLKIKEGARAILCLPAEYIAAQLMIVRALIGKLDLYCIQPSSQPLKNIQKKFPNQQFDFISLVPYQLNTSVQTLKNISYTLIGGAPLSKKIKKKIQNFPTIIFETFGMAETLTHIALKQISNLQNSEKKDIFFTLPSVRIATTKNKELKIKIYNRGLPDFFKTKDIVQIHSQNSFSYLGRSDNIIQTGGLKIQPEVLEEKIQAKIKVLEDMVFFVDSLPHSKLENQLILIVESNSSNSLKDIKESCKKHLKFFEIPKKIFFIQKFLRSKNMKILREKTKKIAITQNLLSNKTN